MQGFWLSGSVRTTSVCAVVAAVSSCVQLPEDAHCFRPLGSFHLLFLNGDGALEGGDYTDVLVRADILNTHFLPLDESWVSVFITMCCKMKKLQE